MTPHLRYGLLGTGTMGIEHLRNLALVPGSEDGLRAVAIGAAAEKSAREKRPVEMR